MYRAILGLRAAAEIARNAKANLIIKGMKLNPLDFLLYVILDIRILREERKMKRDLIFISMILGCMIIAGGCASSGEKKAEELASLTLDNEEIYKCSSDSDCVSVLKDCCLCDGKVAINKKYAKAFNQSKGERCAFVPCTLQMCYVDITPKCVEGKCTGEPIDPPSVLP